MAKVNISQAARLTGKSRTTIHRKLKSGELSMQGGLIDTSELIRVFGGLVPESEQNSTGTPSTKRVTSEQVSVQQQVQLALLQKDIEHLQEKLAAKDALLEEKDKRIALLEHKPMPDSNMSENSVNEMSEKPSKEHWKEQRKKEGRLMKLARFVFDE